MKIVDPDCAAPAMARTLRQALEGACEDCLLRDGTFLGLRLDGCEFKRCAASETSFRDLSLVKASFAGSDLSAAEFVNCDLRGADFRGAKGYVISGVENRLRGARFSLPEALTLLRSLGVILD